MILNGWCLIIRGSLSKENRLDTLLTTLISLSPTINSTLVMGSLKKKDLSNYNLEECISNSSSLINHFVYQLIIFRKCIDDRTVTFIYVNILVSFVDYHMNARQLNTMLHCYKTLWYSVHMYGHIRMRVTTFQRYG